VTINIIKFLNYCFYENYEHDLFLVCNEINEELGVNGHLKKNMTVHYIPKIKNINYENYALGY
jgi:hypothetical protein